MWRRNGWGLAPLALTLSLVASSCSDGSLEPELTIPPPPFAKGGNKGPPAGGGGDDIPLSITFRNAGADGLSGDGSGAYVDGVDFVRALIVDPTGGDESSRGTLRFRAAEVKRNQAPIRLVRVHVTSPDGSETLFSDLANTSFTTFNDPDGGSPADFTAIGAGDSQPMVLKVVWSDENGMYTLRFGRDCDSVLVPANRVVVTGLTSPPDLWSWRVESPGSAILCDTDSSKKGRAVERERAAHVPFEMMLMALQ